MWCTTSCAPTSGGSSPTQGARIIDEVSRVSIHLLYNTKQHCICVGNYQEWKGDVGSGQESKHKSREKVRPLFSAGEGRKRESGISMWNKEGLEFYYMVEKNWREVYYDKAHFFVLINGWEIWEPKDKSKKDALRTYLDWTKDEEENKKMSSKKNRPQEKDWWKQEDEGYNTDRNLKAEYDWEDKTKRMIKERLGVVEEDTVDDSKIEEKKRKL